jgi:hypothetical protein
MYNGECIGLCPVFVGKVCTSECDTISVRKAVGFYPKRRNRTSSAGLGFNFQQCMDHPVIAIQGDIVELLIYPESDPEGRWRPQRCGGGKQPS